MTPRRLTAAEVAVWMRAVTTLLPEASEAAAKSAARALDDPRCYLIVAEDDSSAIGLLSAYRFPDVVAGGELVYLYDIMVAPGKRRRGVGARLIRLLLEHCRNDGVKRIWAGTDTANLAAQRTFARTGGRQVGASYAEYVWDL